MRFSILMSHTIGMVAFAMLLAPLPALAQISTSSSAYADQGNALGPQGPGKLDGIWSLDKTSGAVQIRIPIGTTPSGGRGPKIPFIFQYNSSSTVTLGAPFPITVAVDANEAALGTPVTATGFRFQWQSQSTEVRDNSGAPLGPWTVTYGPSVFQHYDSATLTTPTGSSSSTCATYGPFLYADINGQIHDLNLAVTWLQSGSTAGGLACVTPFNINASGGTTDGSALSSSITGYSEDGGCGSCQGTSGRLGAVLYPDGASAYEDTNGNLVVASEVALQDSEGRTIATSPFGVGSNDIAPLTSGQPRTSAVPGTYTVATTGPNGSPEDYAVTVTAQSPSWNFSLPHPTTSELTVLNISNPSYTITSLSGTENVISTIALPNNTSYSFTYDQVYGTISYIYFPTGGYVHFLWGVRGIGSRTLPGPSIQISAESTLVATDVYVSDGTTTNHWQYSYTNMNLSTGALVTTETAPDGTKTVYTSMPFQLSSVINETKPVYLETLRTISLAYPVDAHTH